MNCLILIVSDIAGQSAAYAPLAGGILANQGDHVAIARLYFLKSEDGVIDVGGGQTQGAGCLRLQVRKRDGAMHLDEAEHGDFGLRKRGAFAPRLPAQAGEAREARHHGASRDGLRREQRRSRGGGHADQFEDRHVLRAKNPITDAQIQRATGRARFAAVFRFAAIDARDQRGAYAIRGAGRG